MKKIMVLLLLGFALGTVGCASVGPVVSNISYDANGALSIEKCKIHANHFLGTMDLEECSTHQIAIQHKN